MEVAMTVVEIFAKTGTAGRIKFFDFLTQPFARLNKTLAERQRRKEYRNDLERLLRVGPHMIADIGLNLETAHREIEKSFWQR
jgi:uncharacterized protein YjiS (DUF1127 family)